MTSILTEDNLRQIRALAEDFSSRAAVHDADASLPVENFRLLHRAGLLALTVPRALGGLGGDLGDVSVVIGPVAKADPATGLILAMQYLQGAALFRSPTLDPALQAAVARAIVDDGSLLNTFFAEPEVGSAGRGGLPGTRGWRDGTNWIVEGSKIYATGCEIVRWGLCWGHIDAAPEPLLGFFLVPLDAPGIAIERSWDHLGMRGTGSHTLRLDCVSIPASNLIDFKPAAQWVQREPTGAIWSAVTLATLYDGVAQAARDWLRSYLRTRVPANLSQPLASLPRFHELFGEIEAWLHGNRALLADAVRRERAGTLGVEEAGLVKYTVIGNAIRAVEKGLAAIGNPGLSRNHALERHYRDILCSRVHSPQDDLLLGAAGRAALAAEVLALGATGR